MVYPECPVHSCCPGHPGVFSKGPSLSAGPPSLAPGGHHCLTSSGQWPGALGLMPQPSWHP